MGMEAKYGENEIRSLLQKVRIFNKDIGQYEMFAITENFDYVVKLSNGRIVLKPEELQRDEREDLTPALLGTIASRFVPSDVSAKDIHPEHVPSATSNGINKRRGFGAVAILVVLVLLVASMVIAVRIVEKPARNAEKKAASGETYREKVMTVEEIERSNPKRFLSAKGTYKKNLWGNKIKLDCVVTNKATVVSYKNAVVRVTFYSDAKVEIGKEDVTLPETFLPNSSQTVPVKVKSPKATGSIKWVITGAKAL